MALVKCPIHGLNYNEDNPRGCPACAAERKGRASQAALMKDLVKATKKADGKPEPPRQDKDSWLSKLTNAVPAYDQRRVIQVGAVVIVALVGALIWMARPDFIEQPVPPPFDAANARTFPVNPGQDISVVFAILGTRSPTTHPTASSVERYSYGTGLYVDAMGGTVYSISLGVPNRTWRGLRVGAPEQEIDGMLTLMNRPETEDQPGGAPVDRGKYVTYQNDAALPARTMTAEVRPPNGCFDAVVRLSPRQLGILADGDNRYPVVSIGTAAPEWVARSITIIDRARSGPLGDRAC